MAPWVNEFFEFSTVRRGAHRRSASDSVAFLEGPQEFERLDDEQLMSMFADAEDEMAPAAAMDTKRETDNRSGSEEPQNVKSEPQNTGVDAAETQFVDPKRVKRYIIVLTK
jgi:hypothetical protein